MMSERTVRWWPLVGIGILFVGFQVWAWVFGDRIDQMRVMISIAVTIIGVLLALIWLLLLSRLPWKRRLLYFGLVIVTLLLVRSNFRFHGVSGNLVPILEWRWASDDAGLVGGVAALEGPVADYPQFLGPDRDATVDGIRLATDWEAHPPREVWRQPVGEAWSAFAVAGDLALTQEQRGDEELVVAFDLATGERVWEHAATGRYETGIGGVGPRATPTVVEGRVFASGAMGRLTALDLETGRSIWSRDLAAEFDLTHPEWGRPGSPLAVDGMVVVSLGKAPTSSLVAVDAASGETVWEAGSDGVGYSSPTVLTLAGRRQIVIFNRASVAGHDVETGTLLWTHPWPFEQPNVALPVAVGTDRLLVSSGYGVGSKMLRLVASGDGFEVETLWESPRLKAKFTNVVEYDDYIYGLDDGVMVCLDPETGERCWKRGRYGHGQVILVGDLLLVQTEKGEVKLLEPNPDELRELSSFAALEGKTWNCPALAGRYLLVRNHLEAALYELPVGG